MLSPWQALWELLRWAKRPFAALFPPVLSEHADGVDSFYMFLVGMSTFFSLLIAGLIVFFAVRYARGRKVDRTRPPESNLVLEIVWSTVPLVLSVVIFFWGARLYLRLFTEPLGGYGEVVYVVGKQWMWKVQHPQGPMEIGALHAPMGIPIRLVMTSQDVIHDFSIPALRIKRDVVPGRYTSLWFQATRTGEFPIYCSEYCGTLHSQMLGKLVIQSPAAYAAWLAQGAAAGTAVQAGERLFTSLGCGGCHGAEGGAIRAPQLAGVFGRPVPLQSGGFATADEAYLRESILFPGRKVVAGYAPVMPTFAGQINEEQMVELIAYLRSLRLP